MAVSESEVQPRVQGCRGSGVVALRFTTRREFLRLSNNVQSIHLRLQRFSSSIILSVPVWLHHYPVTTSALYSLLPDTNSCTTLIIYPQNREREQSLPLLHRSNLHPPGAGYLSVSTVPLCISIWSLRVICTALKPICLSLLAFCMPSCPLGDILSNI